jgi:hypothetical protein
MHVGNRILEWLWPNERRQAKRRTAVPLVAYYWDGGEPHPSLVKNVSPDGMYLVTQSRWYVNTLVTMTLTRTDLSDGARNRSIRVMTRVLRSGTDGIAVAFVWPGKVEEKDGISDKKAVREFLTAFGRDPHPRRRSSYIEVNRRIVPPTRDPG